MKHNQTFASLLAVTCFLALAAALGCAGSTAFHYSVCLDDYPGNTLDVTLEISGWPADTLLFHGVPIYMDNPTAAADTQVVWGLTATNAAGEKLAIEAGEPDAFGQVAHVIRGCGGDLRIEYELLVHFGMSDQTKRYGVILPNLEAKNTWLNGNYVFCHPRLKDDMPRSIRTPVPITVDFEMPGNAPLVGVADSIELNNIYELMSLQFGIGDFYTETGTAGGVEYTVILDDSLAFTAEEREALHDLTGGSISALGDFFGGVPFDRFGVHFKRRHGLGGLEGRNACQVSVFDTLCVTDTDDLLVRMFSLLTLHEIFHTWNPIFLFALEDPWVKEGFSCYYDGVLSARLGYIADEDVDQGLQRYYVLLEENPLFTEVALNDPQLWHKEYDSEDWRTITYDRGLAVTLLLDVHIRETSDNEHSLDDVMRLLYRDFALGSYTHEELLATIESSTGVDARDFFAKYVESTEVPSEEKVKQTLEKAKQLGVFNPGH